MPDHDFAYLSQGRLHRGESGIVESAFGRSLRDRAAQIHDRHAWKTKGRGAQFMQGMLWPGQGHDPGEFRVAITSVCGGREPGAIFYTLETDDVGGIFAVDASGLEERLFHTSDFRVRHIASSPDRGEVAASIVHPNACTNIAVMKADGTGLREVTEGESVDLAPSWVPGDGARRLVFQSAGVGRDTSGRFTRLGPSGVQLLDLDSGDLTTVAEEPEADLLGPRLLADGTLLYIRRPYENGAVKLSPLTILKDTVMLPFRMLYALYRYFNFFSMMYTGKPLSTARGGGAQRQPDMKQMMIWGNLIDAGKTTQGADRSDSEAPSVVPASWQLMRRRPGNAGGAADVMAKGVLSFDITAAGDIVYSNGSAIYRLPARGAAGKPERVIKSNLIEHVAAL